MKGTGLKAVEMIDPKLQNNSSTTTQRKRRGKNPLDVEPKPAEAKHKHVLIRPEIYEQLDNLAKEKGFTRTGVFINEVLNNVLKGA